MRTNRAYAWTLAAALALILALGMAGCASAAKRGGIEYSDCFTIPARVEGDIMATTLKMDLKSDSDDTWAIMLMAGFDYAFDYAAPGQRIAVFITFGDGTAKCYVVAYEAYDSYRKGRLDSKGFTDAITTLVL